MMTSHEKGFEKPAQTACYVSAAAWWTLGPVSCLGTGWPDAQTWFKGEAATVEVGLCFSNLLWQIKA